MKCILGLSIIFICSVQSNVIAQDKFADLSSKERISIAEKEKIEAEADQVFQNLMLEGHKLFKGKHYLKAIHKYEEAQTQRPYNVYPKVIIADIELSMKDTLEILRQEEQRLNEEQTREDKPEIEQKPEQEKNQQSEEERLKKQDEWEKEEREKLQREREKNQDPKQAERKIVETNSDVEILSVEDFQRDLGKKYPVGLTETIKEEGNKTIITRVLVSEGKGNEYKKVVHNWGGIFYFKNGQAVPERVWKSETER